MSLLHQNSGIGRSIPSALEISLGFCPREISWASGMDIPIPPSFWWGTDIMQCVQTWVVFHWKGWFEIKSSKLVTPILLAAAPKPAKNWKNCAPACQRLLRGRGREREWCWWAFNKRLVAAAAHLSSALSWRPQVKWNPVFLFFLSCTECNMNNNATADFWKVLKDADPCFQASVTHF